MIKYKRHTDELMKLVCLILSIIWMYFSLVTHKEEVLSFLILLSVLLQTYRISSKYDFIYDKIVLILFLISLACKLQIISL